MGDPPRESLKQHVNFPIGFPVSSHPPTSSLLDAIPNREHINPCHEDEVLEIIFQFVGAKFLKKPERALP